MVRTKRRRRRAQHRTRNFLIVVSVLLVVGISWLILKTYLDNNFVRYGKTGIFIPKIYSVHGLDVSHHQGTITWRGVAQTGYDSIRIRFVFIKATQGITMVDDHFRDNWAEAGNQNIARGAYHYFEPSANVYYQQQNFIQHVKLQIGDLPPVLDIEQTDGLPVDIIQKAALVWLRGIEKHYGVKPIIYTSVDFYNHILKNAIPEYPLWIAHYTNLRVTPRIDRDWLFWQLSDKSNIDGITRFTDFDVFNGDSAAFENIRIK